MKKGIPLYKTERLNFIPEERSWVSLLQNYLSISYHEGILVCCGTERVNFTSEFPSSKGVTKEKFLKSGKNNYFLSIDNEHLFFVDHFTFYMSSILTF